MSKESDFAEIATLFGELTTLGQAVLGYATICCNQNLSCTVQVNHLCQALKLTDEQWDAAKRELTEQGAVWITGDSLHNLDRLSTYPAVIASAYAIAPTNRPKAKDWQTLRHIVFDKCFGSEPPYCMYCKTDAEPLVLDHALPLARGGSNHPDNFVPACARCNSAKGAKTFEEFMVFRSRSGDARGAH